MKKNKKTREAAQVAATPSNEVSLKTKKTKTTTQDQKNLEVAKKKITKEKDLMYAYPKEVATLELRKKFRTSARRKLESFQKSISKAEVKEKPELIKAAKDWAKGIYTPEHMPIIP